MVFTCGLVLVYIALLYIGEVLYIEVIVFVLLWCVFLFGGRERERQRKRGEMITKFLFPPVYRLYTVVPRLVRFIDQLTNWYVRFNRKRIKV